MPGINTQQAANQLQELSAVDPSQLILTAKQYYTPQITSALKDQGQRFQDFFTALPEGLANTPSAINGLSPEAALRSIMGGVGRAGNLYTQSAGISDFIGNNAKELGQLAQGSLDSRYGKLAQLYGMGAEADRFNQQMDLQKQQLDLQRQNAARASSGSADTFNIAKIIEALSKSGAQTTTPVANQYNAPTFSTPFAVSGGNALNNKIQQYLTMRK